jgi:hypothetical protein
MGKLAAGVAADSTSADYRYAFLHDLLPLTRLNP